MISKKFDTVIEEFGKHRGFTDEETANFKIYVNDIFHTAKEAMKSKKYDFIGFMYMGTFFLKVWTVHKRLNYFNNQVNTGLDRNKGTLAYRKLLAEKIKMDAIYKRMTDNFVKRKVQLLHDRELNKEKKISKKEMMEMIMEDNTNRIEDETGRDIKTGLGE